MVDESFPAPTTLGEVRRRALKIMPWEALKSTAQRTRQQAGAPVAAPGRNDGINAASPAAIIPVTRSHQRGPVQCVGLGAELTQNGVW